MEKATTQMIVPNINDKGRKEMRADAQTKGHELRVRAVPQQIRRAPDGERH